MCAIPEYSANTPGAVVNDLDNASPTAVALIKSQGDNMVALEIQVLQPTSSFNRKFDTVDMRSSSTALLYYCRGTFGNMSVLVIWATSTN